MPSCVVKCCRNNSGLTKKHEGITYHRFPKANEPWKIDWVQIIRECRGEKLWNPSKSSVVCSVHFEDTDLYTTKNGFVRVRLFAVPKKFLLEPPISNNEQPLEPIRQTIEQSEEQPMAGTSKQFIEIPVTTTIEQPFKQYIVKDEKDPVNEHNYCFIDIEQSEEQPIAETSKQFIEIPVTATIEQPFKQYIVKHEEEPVIEHISCFMDRDLSTPVDVKDPLTSLYTPRKQHLNHTILKMRIQMNNKNKKIKTLNQKIRRLQNRNNSLKHILKTLKEKQLCRCINSKD